MNTALIMTRFEYNNYGQKLQNYAVQELLRDCGYRATTFVDRRALPPTRFPLAFWAKAVLGAPLGRSAHRRIRLLQIHKMKAFIRRNLKCVYLNLEELHRCKYDVYVVGSDQVWNTWNRPEEEMRYSFLYFAPRAKRICFAPSFGFERVPEEMRDFYRRSIDEFDMLSCREQSGCEIIRGLTGREAELLCDPTMMFTRERWERFAKKPRWKLPERYVLAYFLGTNGVEDMKRVREFAKQRGLTLVELWNRKYPNYYCIDPAEFVYLVAHADYVCTDSFHGCVFSTLFHRDFTVFWRVYRQESMYGRIITLMETFGLQGRDDLERMGEPADFSKVDAILEAQREKGIRYLRTALERAAAAGEEP